MVSGQPPIHARKLRYFEDANFTGRVLPAPALACAAYADCPPVRPDDWTDLAVPPVLGGVDEAADYDLDEQGGVQIRPELDEDRTVVVEPVRDDLALLDDDDDLSWAMTPDPELTRAARLAALDPDDGIAL